MSRSVLTPEVQKNVSNIKGSSVVMTANGTIHTTEEATVHVCDLEMFVEVQPQYSRWGKQCDENGYSNEWHPAKTSHLRNERKPMCKIHSHLLWWSQACKQPNTRPEHNWRRTRSVGDHELNVEPDLTACLQTFTEGSQGDRQVRQTSPRLTWKYHRQFFFLPGILQRNPPSNRAGGKHNLFTHVLKDPNCEVCRRTKVTESAMQKKY